MSSMAQKVLELFEANDEDGSGTIDFAEFKNLMCAIASDVDDDTISQMLQAADLDADGQLSYEEFVQWAFEGEGVALLADQQEDGPDGDDCEEAGEEAGPAPTSRKKAQWKTSLDDCRDLVSGLEGRQDDDDFQDACCDARPDPVVYAPAVLGPVLAGFISDPSQAKLFQSVSPNCLKQGALGDCWYLAAIASLAEYPELIYSCFPNGKTVAEDGMYQVRLFDPTNFQEHVIEVDDKVPCYNLWDKYAKPVFVEPTSNEIFVMILEKAAAKFGHMGLGGLEAGSSWLSLKGGAMPYGWAMLTGVQDSAKWERTNESDTWKENVICEWINKGRFTATQGESMKSEDFFQKMVEWDSLGAMMGAAKRGGCETEGGLGLVTGHAYSVVAVQECSAGRVIQCRNPWGTREWTGPLSDSSGFWETVEGAAAAEELQYVPKDDGLFWMPWEEFATRFTKVFVTQTRAKKRDFVEEFTEAFFQMVARNQAGRFEGALDAERQALKYLWDSYAGPMGGFIDEQQLLVLLKMLNMPPENEEDDLIATYQEFDTDEDGQVGWDDFFNEMVTRVGDY